MKLKGLLLAAMLISIAFLAVCASGVNRPDAPPGPYLGRTAPDFILTDINAKEIALSDFRGKPVLLNFWTTTCFYCIYQTPFLISAYNDYADDDLVVLGINVGDGLARASAFASHYGITFPVLLDTDGHVARQYYNVSAFPISFLIDRRGIIQDIRVGAFQDSADVSLSLMSIME